jgi:hypothetical protein
MVVSDLPHEGEGSPDGLSIDNIIGGLASAQTFERLNQIDRVRALGVWRSHCVAPACSMW